MHDKSLHKYIIETKIKIKKNKINWTNILPFFHLPLGVYCVLILGKYSSKYTTKYNMFLNFRIN